MLIHWWYSLVVDEQSDNLGTDFMHLSTDENFLHAINQSTTHRFCQRPLVLTISIHHWYVWRLGWFNDRSWFWLHRDSLAFSFCVWYRYMDGIQKEFEVATLADFLCCCLVWTGQSLLPSEFANLAGILSVALVVLYRRNTRDVQ